MVKNSVFDSLNAQSLFEQRHLIPYTRYTLANTMQDHMQGPCRRRKDEVVTRQRCEKEFESKNLCPSCT